MDNFRDRWSANTSPQILKFTWLIVSLIFHDFSSHHNFSSLIFISTPLWKARAVLFFSSSRFPRWTQLKNFRAYLVSILIFKNSWWSGTIKFSVFINFFLILPGHCKITRHFYNIYQFKQIEDRLVWSFEDNEFKSWLLY